MTKFSNSLSDNELLRLMSEGDRQALSEIYRRHQLSIYQFARFMSGSSTLAEDVTQETFLTLIRETGRYDNTRGTVQAFLYGIARNHVKRAQVRNLSLLSLAPYLESGDDEEIMQLIAPDNPLNEYARNETIKLIRQAVLNLPVRYREVIVVCDFQEMSYSEAAQVLGCPVGTINSRLHRAHSLLLKKLRAALVGSTDLAGEQEVIMRCFA